MTYRFPIVNGDRVALAPHLDLWMAGRRFGIVIEQSVNEENERRYCVEFDGGPLSVWLTGEDLLGAINPVPGQYAEQAEESVRGCSCGMADYGAPGHDGDPNADGEED